MADLALTGGPLFPAVLSILAIPLFAAFNRFRGGGFGDVPGARYEASLAVAAVATLFLPFVYGCLFGACFLLWSLPGWGRWYTIGRIPRMASSGAPSWFERLIERTGWPDAPCFMLRNVIVLLPGVPLFGPWLAIVAIGQPAAYEIGWHLRPGQGTIPGEWITGALWGATLFGVVMTWH